MSTISLIKKELQSEGFPEFMIDRTINKINNFSGTISEAFNDWMSNGKEPSIVVEDYSYTELIEKYSMTSIGAFITLDWLVKDPEKAKKALTEGIR
jgi:hypothetical protein